MVAAATMATLGRNLITTLYGDDYAEAAELLPRLVAAAIPWAITSVYLTEARVRHRHGATVAITATLSLAILVPALVLVPDRGLDGAATAFLGGNLVAAVVAILLHLSGRASADAAVPSHSPNTLEPDEAITLAPLG